LIAYLDPSALVKLFLDEDESGLAREVWRSDVPAVTSRISQVELACAIEAAVRDARLSRGDVDPGVVDGTVLWSRADAVEADPVVIGTAAILGMRHGLRGFDAVHVASAVELSELDPVLVSWDTAQRRAARVEGLLVYPDGTITEPPPP
jgi:hypothetical protein